MGDSFALSDLMEDRTRWDALQLLSFAPRIDPVVRSFEIGVVVIRRIVTRDGLVILLHDGAVVFGRELYRHRIFVLLNELA